MRAYKTGMLAERCTVQTRLLRSQMDTSILLGAGPKDTVATLWLYGVPVLSLSERLNPKKLDWVVWQKRFQVSSKSITGHC